MSANAYSFPMRINIYHIGSGSYESLGEGGRVCGVKDVIVLPLSYPMEIGSVDFGKWSDFR
jgi:hypothetical protein